MSIIGCAASNIEMVVSGELTRRLSWNMPAVFLLVALVITPVSLAGPQAKSNDPNAQRVAKSPAMATGKRAGAGRRSKEQATNGVDVRDSQSTRHWKLTTVQSGQHREEPVKQRIRVEEKWIDLKTGESY